VGEPGGLTLAELDSLAPRADDLVCEIVDPELANIGILTAGIGARLGRRAGAWSVRSGPGLRGRGQRFSPAIQVRFKFQEPLVSRVHSRRTQNFSLLALVLACAIAPSCSRAAARRNNVLFICIDTLRADRLGCYGYAKNPTSPRIDALAAESILFEDTAAAAAWTKPSVPSFLTGTYPLQHGVYEGNAKEQDGEKSDVLPPEADTLAERFARGGYRTAAFVHNAHLRRGLGCEQGFERYEDKAGDARSIRWSALDWLEETSGDERPFLLYLHILDAHWPYGDVPEDYARLFAADTDISPFRGPDSRVLRDGINAGSRTLTESERAGLSALYDGAIRSIDEQLGLLFRELRRRGTWDDTIVCLVADHGEEFLEHGKVGHGHGLWENLLGVPWILRIPGRAGERIQEPVALVDLVPTLCAAVGLPIEAPTEGQNRLGDRLAERALFAEHKEPGTYVQSYRKGRFKLLRRFKPAATSQAALAPRELLKPGSRWEAQCELARDGSLRATRLSPREEPPGDPIEIKGPVARLTEGRFELNGIPVKLAEGCEFYGELAEAAARGAMLVEGLGIKAVGAFDDGVFLARKIKLYAQGKPADSEVRGSVEAVEAVEPGAAGEASDAHLRLRLGGVWIECGERTTWNLDTASHADLTREDIARIVQLGGDGAGKAGFDLELELYDLASDPLEKQPVEDPATRSRLSQELDELARQVLGRRAFGPAERTALDAAEVRDLRAIGY
jgi:arylsulfatase A-like enzyme